MAIYKKSELQGMKRFLLRKTARAMGYDAEKVAELTQEQLIEWILENQEEDGKGKKEEKEEPKKGRGVPARGKKEEKDEKDDEKEDERPRGLGEGKSSSRDDGDVADQLKTLEKKLDAIGEVLDALTKSSTEQLNELRADVYVLTGGFKYFAKRMEAEEIITGESADDDRTVADEMEKIEGDIQGS